MTDEPGPQTDAAFLAGGGQLGARMRGHDWSKTPLGAPAGWPQSLKTIVRMMLHSRFAMWMAWGPEGTFFCNDAYFPTVGIKRDWVLGARADRVWAEIWDDIGPRIAHVLATGEATWDEGLQLFLERSGYLEETFHTFSYSPVHDDAGEVAGMLCVVAEDTDRVIGERRLKLLRDLAALPSDQAGSPAEAGVPLVEVLATAPFDVPFAALYLTDAGGAAAHQVAATPAAAAHLPDAVALDDDQSPWAIGRAIRTSHVEQIDDVAAQRAEIRGPWPEPVEQALVLPLAASGQALPFGALVVGVSTRRRLDERYRAFLSVAGGQVASHLADTRARLAERRRAEALAELDRAKSTFFSNVSHEFRTPLTLMLGPVDALLDGPDPILPTHREALALVRRNGLRLRKLVNSLLDFSRIEAGRLETRLQRVDLAALTRDIASVFRAAIEQAGLTFTVACDELDEPVSVDPEMWEKVVLNLLSNALKFTFEGAIELRLRPLGGNVELSVSDSGVGIAADALPLVFDRFHRVHGTRSRSQEGTGIGLALVKELVRLQGGSIAVRSEVNRGSTFVVTMPRAAAPSPAEAADVDVDVGRRVDAEPYLDDALRAVGATPSGPEGAGADPRGRRPRVLVVDDNADMRTYLQRLLAERWDVVTAGDGLQALAQLDGVDVVVADVMMPRLDGYGLVERLRGDLATLTLPIILLSAQAGEEARIGGLARGADDYLVKPFPPRELMARVDVQLMRARLRHAEEALATRLAEVFRHAPVGMALLGGADHTFEFANASYRGLVGQRSLIGLPIRDALPELAGQGVYELLDGVQASGQPHVGRAFPALLRDADGALQRRWFDFVYQPLQREAGEHGGIAVICFDVTDTMAAREEAESASRAKDEFIAMLGHELRNPLAPMLTALHLMKMQWPDVAVRERDVIDRQLQHMVRLLDDLLDVARITRGSIELKRSEVELSEVIAQAVETASPLLEKRGLALDLDVPARGLAVNADAVRLSQVVGNLLSNAAKFSDTGKAVEVRARRDGSVVELVVRDEGIGMTAEEVGKIFDIFVQGRQALDRPRGGLGLGLTIARSLAALHGGTLTAASDGIGRGTTFTLRLAASTGAQYEDAGAAPPLDDIDGRGRRVLVVDDNVDAAESLSDLLEIWGFEVAVAHDGPAALAALAERAADAALLDIGLPVMDGYELAQRIRGTDAGRAMRLIALTGYGQASDRRRSREFGFDAHLVKPVDADQLSAALASLAGKAAGRSGSS